MYQDYHFEKAEFYIRRTAIRTGQPYRERIVKEDYLHRSTHILRKNKLSNKGCLYRIFADK